MMDRLRLEARNPKYALPDRTDIIEVEINHPDHGWIPYAINPADTDQTVDNDYLLEQIDLDSIAPCPHRYPHPADLVRLERDTRLTDEVDPYVSNKYRFDALTPDQQQALLDYRQELLDITDQEGFPDNVIWPVLVV